MPNIIHRNSVEAHSLIDYYFLHQLPFKTLFRSEDFIYKMASDIDFIYFILTDISDSNLSTIRFKKVLVADKNYFQVNKSYSWINGKGYGTYLYRFCINYFKSNVLSDCRQSKPGSCNIWKRLIKDDIFLIQRLDLLSGEISNIPKNYDEYDIWGSYDYEIESVKEIPFDEVFDDIFNDELDDFLPKNEYLYDEKYNDSIVPNDVINFIRKALEKKKKIRDLSSVLLIASINI